MDHHDEQLDNLFKPSAWSPKLTPDGAIEKFLRVGRECWEENRKYFVTSVSYGPRKAMCYDLYESAELAQDAPLFVFIHGGYWQESNKEGNTFMVSPLVTAGCRVCVIGYDLCPSVTLSELHDEVQAALSHILISVASGGSSPSSVIICGHSAGACLALAMLTKGRWEHVANSQLIRSVVLLSGVYDLTEAKLTEVVNKNNLLGLTESNVTALSPLHQEYSHLSATGVRVFVVTAEYEAPKLVEQGLQMYRKLKSSGVNVELEQAKGFDHFDLVTELRIEDCFLTQKMIGICRSENK